MFDIVIVGAGSAGCALAARASENPNLSVLLVEAGPDYPDLAATPADLLDGHENSLVDHDWGFSHAPVASRELSFPRGRVTGGSSAVNTAIALRGIPEDFAEWADQGLPEWDWAGVLPAYRRLERDLDFGDQPFHGDAGPIPIRRYPPSEMAPQHLAFLDAASRLGYPACPDANDPDGSGASPMPMNKLGRLRVSAASGYLAPARIRPNLVIRPNTLVSRLLVENGGCTGVEVTGPAGRQNFRGRLAVLAAGAIQTPPILMRSGLGPKAQLEAHGIELVRDVSGVGQNLSDHPAISVTLRPKDFALVERGQPIIQTILRYTAEGSAKRNDLQIEMISFARGKEPLFAIAGVLEYQRGRGELTLASADPHAAPVIHHRFCEDDTDARLLAGCLQDVLAFARSPPIADLAQAVVFPRGDVDPDAAIGICRRFSGSGYHPCGTAKMGPATDPTAVVDQHGRCHFLDGLVIADASIMPSVPRANTNLTAIMIGEKVGEWLRTRPAIYGL